MNKAFVREPDDDGTRQCPRCGSVGSAVSRETLNAWLKPEAVVLLSDSYFCPLPNCDVVYFDSYGREVPTASLVRPAWPKDRTAPLCGCFGLTRDDIEADVAEGGVRRTRAAVERAKSSAARCLTQAADGRSCVAEVQRYYMRLRGGGP